MRNDVIETQQLSFGFKRNAVVRDISLRVPEGSIYGFLGPNGAGKTTTIRLLLGLLRQTPDNIRLFGMSLKQNRLQILRRTGSLIEVPSLYGHLTAKENMRATACLRETPRSRIEACLRLMGLEKASEKLVKTFSQGMKQRLGLAIALISAPDLLILDEPTNGLDPQGIADVRGFLRELNRTQGTSIFLSSHLLGEMEKLADHIGILHQGDLLFQGSLGAMRKASGGGAYVEIKTGDPVRAAGILQPRVTAQAATAATLKLAYHSEKEVAAAVRKLVEAGLDVFEVTPVHHTLEELFLTLTAGQNPVSSC